MKNRLLVIVMGVGVLAVVVVVGRKGIETTTPQGDVVISPEDIARMVAGSTPHGWEIYDQVMYFTPENIYEQINGRAEFYLAYDMIGMTFASFEKRTDDDVFMDLSIYDMGTPTNAFGVFSGERSIGAPNVGLGRDAYRTGAYFYVWKGPYYVQVIASDTSAVYQQIGLEMAREITDFLYDSGEPVWGLAALPEKDRVPGSEQYFLVDAMGLDFMRHTYTAHYNKGGIDVTAFLSRQESPESAQTTITQFVEHAQHYGNAVIRSTIHDAELIICDMGGRYDVFFMKDHLVAGVYGVENKSLAVQSAIDLWGQL